MDDPFVFFFFFRKKVVTLVVTFIWQEKVLFPIDERSDILIMRKKYFHFIASEGDIYVMEL
jgi:hypothetical protein